MTSLFLRTLKNWFEFILNYFMERWANVFIGCSNSIRGDNNIATVE
jgi:hypothetical protein